MTEDELVTVELRDSFYRDSISKVVLIILGICVCAVLTVGLSVYLYLNPPAPVIFPVYEDWRIQPPVPLVEPYKTTPELLQWVANAMMNSFVYDYINYNEQKAQAQIYFTNDGWTQFLNQLNTYANYNNVQTNRLFVLGRPKGAPFVINEREMPGRYTWWVQMPMSIKYKGMNPPPDQDLIFELTIVRVSTVNNLDGIAIDDISLVKPPTK